MALNTQNTPTPTLPSGVYPRTVTSPQYEAAWMYEEAVAAGLLLLDDEQQYQYPALCGSGDVVWGATLTLKGRHIKETFEYARKLFELTQDWKKLTPLARGVSFDDYGEAVGRLAFQGKTWEKVADQKTVTIYERVPKGIDRRSVVDVSEAENEVQAAFAAFDSLF